MKSDQSYWNTAFDQGTTIFKPYVNTYKQIDLIRNCLMAFVLEIKYACGVNKDCEEVYYFMKCYISEYISTRMWHVKRIYIVIASRCETLWFLHAISYMFQPFLDAVRCNKVQMNQFA